MKRISFFIQFYAFLKNPISLNGLYVMVFIRVAISDRKNRQNRIGVGKFSDRPEFGRQSRQILSEKSGNRQNRGIGKIGRSEKSADRQNRQIGKSRQKRPRAQRNALIG